MLALELTMALPPRLADGPRGILILGLLLLLGLGASAGFFRWAARDVAEGILGELAARPSVPAEQLDLWLLYGEPQIQNRLMGLRFSTALPALVTHVDEPEVPGGPARVYGIDLRTERPARVVREDLRIEVRLGAPELLAEGPLVGEGADRVPRAGAGAGPGAGRAFAQGVIEWALEPLIGALPRDIEGAELAVILEDAPFVRAESESGARRPSPARPGPALAAGVTLALVLGLALALTLAARRGRRAAGRG